MILKDTLIAESYNYPGDGRGYGKFKLKENDQVFVQIQFSNGEIVAVDFMDYKRNFPTILIIVIFLALLILFGQKQGFKSVITLGFTLFIIFKFMIPYLFLGYNPIYLALFTGTIVTASTCIMVSGFTFQNVSGCIWNNRRVSIRCNYLHIFLQMP